MELNHSLRLAFCSVVTALGTAVMFLTGMIPVGTYALPAFAGILMISVVAEAGTGWAFSVYAAQSILSVLLAADKEAVLFFVLFFGYYPILKSLLENHLRRIKLQTAVKLIVFNAAAVLDFCLSVAFLSVPKESFSIFGYYLPWLFLLAGNVVFLIYDYAVSLLVITYFSRIHPMIKKLFRSK
ncbi:hypothetical protein A7X67_15250 [Clostridium sp. W14A]|nr:hypothetical protein A7X67_15250 [Clostridium sp. W14A]